MATLYADASGTVLRVSPGPFDRLPPPVGTAQTLTVDDMSNPGLVATLLVRSREFRVTNGTITQNGQPIQTATSTTHAATQEIINLLRSYDALRREKGFASPSAPTQDELKDLLNRAATTEDLNDLVAFLYVATLVTWNNLLRVIAP